MIVASPVMRAISPNQLNVQTAGRGATKVHQEVLAQYSWEVATRGQIRTDLQ